MKKQHDEEMESSQKAKDNECYHQNKDIGNNVLDLEEQLKIADGNDDDL